MRFYTQVCEMVGSTNIFLLTIFIFKFYQSQAVPINGTSHDVRCGLPKDVGDCDAIIPRYFFNAKGQCEKFNYGGCGGNENNFGTKEECEKACKINLDKVCPVIDCIPGCSLHTSEDDPCGKCVCSTEVPCGLPKVVGNCEAIIPRYFFNTNGQCEKFNYGGCGGNENNFETKEKCEKACKINLDKVCPIIDCIPGCSLHTSEDHPCGKCVCPTEITCKFPKVVGHCKAAFKRFYFNANGKCEEFIYGGCGGNENNFQTQGECEKTCGNSTASPKEACPMETCKLGCELQTSEDDPCGKCVCKTDVSCGLPKAVGVGKAALTKFYFNANGQCEKFVYGGSGGNENNFATEEECNKACGTKADIGRCGSQGECPMPDCLPGCTVQRVENKTCEECVCMRNKICFDPPDAGNCKALIRRYFFNAPEGKCQNFTYGGCDGNGNNFKTIEECEATCKRITQTPERVCPMLKCPGSCPRGTDELGCPSCDCPIKALCYLPVDKGSSEANITRFHFNWESGKCETFSYGGAEGNENNFDTESRCSNTCKKRKPLKIASDVDHCRPECPQDCGQKDLGDGCHTCVCDGSFAPDGPPPSPKPESSGNEIDDCKPECPQDCGRKELDNGCYSCSCGEPYVPVDHPPPSNDEKCKPECPQDCGQIELDNGCHECVCDGSFAPDGPKPAPKPESSGNEIDDCKPVCPQDCGRKELDNGCYSCSCGGSFVPVDHPPPSNDEKCKPECPQDCGQIELDNGCHECVCNGPSPFGEPTPPRPETSKNENGKCKPECPQDCAHKKLQGDCYECDCSVSFVSK